MIVNALIVVCGSTWCEPAVITYTPDRYYYDAGYERQTTAEWCRESLPFHIRDMSRVSPETKDIHYLDPKVLGVPGLTFVPEASECWPLAGGPQ
jgi:hypothetical protein